MFHHLWSILCVFSKRCLFSGLFFYEQYLQKTDKWFKRDCKHSKLFSKSIWIYSNSFTSCCLNLWFAIYRTHIPRNKNWKFITESSSAISTLIINAFHNISVSCRKFIFDAYKQWLAILKSLQFIILYICKLPYTPVWSESGLRHLTSLSWSLMRIRPVPFHF